MARAADAGARGEISRRRAARVSRLRGSARASCRGRVGRGRGVTREGRDADARATPECRKRARPLRGPFESSGGCWALTSPLDFRPFLNHWQEKKNPMEVHTGKSKN